MTTDTITPGDVIMHPERNTTMWRALEVDHEGNQVRAIRSNKQGDVHGLVRNPEGTWIPMQKLDGFTVIGHFVEAKGTGARAAAAAAHNGKPRGGESMSGTIAAPVLDGNDKALKFIELTLRSMADNIAAIST